MTYYLPESDRLVADGFNDLLDAVADMDESHATALEVGATTVIQTISESIADLHRQAVASASLVGVTEEEATASVKVVFDALFAIVNPRLDALRQATQAAKGVEPVAEDDLTDEQINDLLESLFAGLIGEEAAAELRAEVEADEVAKREGYVTVDPSDEAEVEKFFDDLFEGMYL